MVRRGHGKKERQFKHIRKVSGWTLSRSDVQRPVMLNPPTMYLSILTLSYSRSKTRKNIDAPFRNEAANVVASMPLFEIVSRYHHNML